MLRKHPRKWTVIASSAAALILGLSGTGAAWAFMTAAQTTAANHFSVASCKASIVEDFLPPQTIEPGLEVTKVVRVKNEGASPCFIRASVRFDDKECERWASILFNASAWEDGGDGFRYLREQLAPGELSAPVCTKVSISPDARDDQLREFSIIALCEACFVKGHDGNPFPNAQAAFAAQGSQDG